MNNLNRKVFMVGPSLETQGGISSVLSVYMKNFKQSLNLGFIPSYSGENRIKDIIFFAKAIIKVLFINFFTKG